MLDFNFRETFADKINHKIDTALTGENAQKEPRDYLGASRLGAECEFLRDGVLDVQRRINPDMAIWILHHLNKINTKALEDALFNAISGGGSLRGFYTVGVVAYHPDINMPEVKLCFELRNGPSIPPKLVVNKNGRWEELSPEERHLAERKNTPAQALKPLAINAE